MKYLLLIAFLFVIFWIVRKGRAVRSDNPHVSTRTAERMVKCAYCGVNQPVSESILINGRYYCCPEHRHEAESIDS